MKLLNWLKRPFPFLETIEEKMAISLLLGIIVTLILGIFQPFDISEIGDIKYLVVIGFGAVTVTSTLSMSLLFSLTSIRNDQYTEWSIGKQIIYLIVLLTTIALGNWWFTESLRTILDFHPFSLTDSLIATPLVGIIPVVVSLFYSERILRKRHSNTADVISSHINNHTVADKNIEDESDTFPYPSDSFLYAKSEGNYIQVYLQINSQPTVVRQTMKELEILAQRESSIVRCHRSFLINLSKVTKVSGDARGYKVTLDSISDAIPISRNYSSLVIDRLSSF